LDELQYTNTILNLHQIHLGEKNRVVVVVVDVVMVVVVVVKLL
jgi:hypothetical protein